MLAHGGCHAEANSPVRAARLFTAAAGPDRRRHRRGRAGGRLASALLGPAREDSRGRMNQPQTLGTRRKAMNSQLRHIVIIVKENHTFDNYLGTFPGANGAVLGKAANPPPDDPNHRHQAWMQRQNDTVHRLQYNKGKIPAYFALE